MSARVSYVSFGLLLVAAVVFYSLRGLGDPRVHEGDTPAYLAAAYNLAYHGTFSESSSATPPAPGIGREPGYAAFLAALMVIDKNGLAKVRPECIDVPQGCGDIYRSAQLANVALIALSGVCLFAATWIVTGGSPLAALAAGSYILLNYETAKWRRWLMSDHLALFLVTLTMFLASLAFRYHRAGAWLLVGFGLGALAMTKGVFLIFTLAALIGGLVTGLIGRKRSVVAASVAVALGFTLLVGPWIARNAAIVGRPAFSDERGGIALSTREALNHMTPAEYAAAFVFWTRGFGDKLAYRLFGDEAVRRLALPTPGGFYDVGQHSYVPRVEAKMRALGLTRSQAIAAVDREILDALLAAPVAYAVTFLPVFYRGIWIDEFIVFGLPALAWATYVSVLKRNLPVLLMLSTGWFNLVFYALVSLNIPRYQITAVPALALASALAIKALLQKWHSSRRPSRDEQPGAAMAGERLR